MQTDGDATTDAALRLFATQVLGRDDLYLKRIAGGASRASYFVLTPEGRQPEAVLRVDEGRGALSGTELDLSREARVMRAMREHGLPVPRIRGEAFKPPALLMDFVPGEARMNATTADVVGRAYMELIAAVHTVDPRSVFADAERGGAAALQQDFQWWAAMSDEDGPSAIPMIEAGRRVLQNTMPDPDPCAVLLHGDAGAGNFLVDGGEITGLIDWEMAHLGDFHEDLAWVWARAVFTPFGRLTDRLRDYELASGRTLDTERLDWYRAFVLWKSLIAVHRVDDSGDAALSATARFVSLGYLPLLGAALIALAGRHGDVGVPTQHLEAIAREAEQSAAEDSRGLRVVQRIRAQGTFA